MSRAKNTATAEEICGVLRQTVSGLQDDAFLKSDLEVIIERYEKFMVMVFKATSRPILSVLHDGTVLAFGDKASTADILAFSSRLMDCFNFIKTKSKNFTSGKKLAPAVFRLCSLFAEKHGKDDSQTSTAISSSSSQPRPPFLARELKRRRSDPKESSSKDPLPRTTADILASFGVKGPKQLQRRPTVVELISSQEVGSEDDQLDANWGRSTSSSSASKGKKLVLQFFDSCNHTMVRNYDDGSHEVAVMEKGPSAFAVAVFGNERIATEMPNILLDAKPMVKEKKSRAKAVCKRPASRMPEEAADEEAADDEVASTMTYSSGEDGEDGPEQPEAVAAANAAGGAAALVINKYIKMYYKATNSFGIRQCFGEKHQIFNISCRGKSKAVLENIAVNCLARLRAGGTEIDVKAFKTQQIALL